MNIDWRGFRLDDAATRKPEDERPREIVEAVAFAVGNRIRIDALAILNDGIASPSEIAKILNLNVRLVGNHIRELFECGCIELVETEKVRNATEHFYRAVTLPYVDEETYRAMPRKLRRELCSLIIQAIMAEVLASLRAKKIEDDDDVRLSWQRLCVDAEGEQEVATELKECAERLFDIQARNAARLAESKKIGVTRVVALMAFERSRPGRPDDGYAQATQA
jgi:DNA-binding transcriptional ArsR family regulator